MHRAGGLHHLKIPINKFSGVKRKHRQLRMIAVVKLYTNQNALATEFIAPVTFVGALRGCYLII